MAAIGSPQHQVVQAIYRLYEQREAVSGGHRAHLGASVIGHACERYLWLMFRWAHREAFDGRMLRLFEYGKRFEERITDELRDIGVEVHCSDEFGQQYRVQAVQGHFGGSLDGAALELPEAPKSWHVLEFKTANAKSFAQLQAKGVQEAKPMHWAQMQIYMGLTGMDRALYVAENKDTSELYQERVSFDTVEFSKLLARAERVIKAAEPPPRLSADPAWFACKFCHCHELCHGQRVPEVNCRTCAHSTPRTDAEGALWVCEHQKVQIDDRIQRKGCDAHRFIPILLERIGEAVEYRPERDGNSAVVYRLADGSTFVNGCAPAFSSREIAASHHASMLGDPAVQQLKTEWPNARMVA